MAYNDMRLVYILARFDSGTKFFTGVEDSQKYVVNNSAGWIRRTWLAYLVCTAILHCTRVLCLAKH